MKLDEFKAWFDGYTESMEGPPSAKQWKRIKERVAEVDGVAVSYPVYIDRYVRPYYPYWSAPCTATGLNAHAQTYDYYRNVMSAAGTANNFDGVTAMYAAGKAEAAQ